jgi:hypothetical protein
MDSINNSQKPTIQYKEFIYAQWFSSKTNTTMSFKDKMELYTLICYLTQQLRKKDPVKYGTPIKVLGAIFNRDFEAEHEPEKISCEVEYIVGLGIVCADLLWGTEDAIATPPGFKNGNEIVNKIKQLIEQWLPF